MLCIYIFMGELTLHISNFYFPIFVSFRSNFLLLLSSCVVFYVFFFLLRRKILIFLYCCCIVHPQTRAIYITIFVSFVSDNFHIPFIPGRYFFFFFIIMLFCMCLTNEIFAFIQRLTKKNEFREDERKKNKILNTQTMNLTIIQRLNKIT